MEADKLGPNCVASRLLLLPSPPSSISLDALHAAYYPVTSEVLTRIASKTSQSGSTKLDIVLWWDDVGLRERIPRSRLYNAAQEILAGFYKLLCFICVESRIGQEYRNEADFRVVLAYDKEETDDVSRPELSTSSAQGPILSLRGLAWSSRQWKDIYVPEGEHSESFLQRFTKLRRGLPLNKHASPFEIHRLMGGTIIKLPNLHPESVPQDKSGKRHLSVAVGGTFDHLHAGHKLLLTATALVLEPFETNASSKRCLTIGITGDELLKNKKYAEYLESWDLRQVSVYNFLEAIVNFGDLESTKVERVSNPGPNGKAVIYELPGRLTIRCVEISDPFGPTITDELISALVISGETRAGGKAVNEKRAEKGWEGLEIFEVDVLDAEADKEGIGGHGMTSKFESKISSTEIRRLLQEGRSK